MRFQRFILVLVFTLVGCKKLMPDFIPDPQGWFIESYDNGTITVQHNGYRYVAHSNWRDGRKPHLEAD
jgi:hypothetical protein